MGDGCSVGNAVNLENARVQHGMLHLGQIILGHNSNIGSYAILEGNTVVEDWGHLEGQSALGDGGSVPAGRVWRGSPARDAGAFDARSLPPRPPLTRLRQTAEGLYFVVGALLIATLFFLPVFPSFVLIDWFDDAERFPFLAGNEVWFQLCKYLSLIHI